MSTVRLILGDQLNPGHAWFGKVDPSVTYVMMEVRSETDYVRHHAQKVLAIFAGMRRLAERLRAGGHKVRYFRIGDADNTQRFADNLRLVLRETGATRFEHQEPDEWRLDRDEAPAHPRAGLERGWPNSGDHQDARHGGTARKGAARGRGE